MRLCLISSNFQLLPLVTLEFNLQLLLEVLSYVIPYLIVILKYVVYCIKTESVSRHKNRDMKIEIN